MHNGQISRGPDSYITALLSRALGCSPSSFLSSMLPPQVQLLLRPGPRRLTLRGANSSESLLSVSEVLPALPGWSQVPLLCHAPGSNRAHVFNPPTPRGSTYHRSRGLRYYTAGVKSQPGLHPCKPLSPSYGLGAPRRAPMAESTPKGIALKDTSYHLCWCARFRVSSPPRPSYAGPQVPPSIMLLTLI